MTTDMVSWLNAARANPAQACADVGVSLNEGLPAGAITETPKHPLVLDARLTTAAQKQAELILDTGILDHNLNGTPQTRAASEGYRASAILENAGVTVSGAVFYDPVGVLHRQHNAYIAHAGHRVQLFDERTSNVGVGVAIGEWNASPAMASVIMFAATPTRPAERLFYRFGVREPGTVLE